MTKKTVVELNSHELATVLDALCLFKTVYEGKDADCKRTAYMEHYGCDCGVPLVNTEEIGALSERIKLSPKVDPEPPGDGAPVTTEN